MTRISLTLPVKWKNKRKSLGRGSRLRLEQPGQFLMTALLREVDGKEPLHSMLAENREFAAKYRPRYKELKRVWNVQRRQSANRHVSETWDKEVG